MNLLFVYSVLLLPGCALPLVHQAAPDHGTVTPPDAAMDAGGLPDVVVTADRSFAADVRQGADASPAADAATPDGTVPDDDPLLCLQDRDCDDGLACTADSCDPAGYCRSQNQSDCDWPAQSTGEAENLTGLGGALLDNPFGRDLSGASWNPLTRELWICRNNGPSMIWMLRQAGDGSFYIPEQDGQRAEWSDFGDAEGLTLADFNAPTTLFVIQEGVNEVVQYDLSTYGHKVELHRWHTGADMPSSGNSGAEGIAFVPNSVLQRTRAIDDQGQPLRGTQGLDGIMLVAHQNGGGIYAFDLKPDDDSYVFRGAFLTARSESAGLELDRDAGLLYIWHGADFNELEISHLSSSVGNDGAVLNNSVVIPGPDAPLIGGDNFEGIALEPLGACVDGKRSLFLTIDGGHSQSLYRYRDFICPP